MNKLVKDVAIEYIIVKNIFRKQKGIDPENRLNEAARNLVKVAGEKFYVRLRSVTFRTNGQISIKEALDILIYEYE